MNTLAFEFFRQHYAPGRVCLVGLSDPMYQLIRIGQSKITSDKKRSKWNHTFLMGERRGATGKEKIYILESDIHFSWKELQFINGPQESPLEKWCKDTIEHACVLGLDLTPDDQKKLNDRGLEIAYDPRYRYPVGELFGTLWAMLTGTLHKRNIFDEEYAIQCATFVRMCYQAVGKELLVGSSDSLSNTSPERLHQGNVFTFKQEWHKS
ncbi:MAG: hypothetical protein Q8P51_13285 [Ignavibacteria bacterium]|nr:hypothetical protein [Ignavibacteria bacterium]